MNYSAYGQTISSEFELPLPQSDLNQKSDIFIRVEKIREPEDPLKTWDHVYYKHKENDIFLKWPTLCCFRIKDGKTIIIDPIAQYSASAPQITTPLLGSVTAAVLQQKGLTALHGSAARINNKAVIFLGNKGGGKSTMIGFLRNKGHQIISDDICPIMPRKHNHFTLLPSFPKMKLWPKSLAYLNINPEEHEKVHPEYEKRNVLLDKDFCHETLEVQAIFILKSGNNLLLEQLNGVSALSLVGPHMIINRFSENQPPQLKKSIFSQLTNLVQHLPIYQLSRPRNLDLLPKIENLIKTAIR